MIRREATAVQRVGLGWTIAYWMASAVFFYRQLDGAPFDDSGALFLWLVFNTGPLIILAAQFGYFRSGGFVALGVLVVATFFLADAFYYLAIRQREMADWMFAISILVLVPGSIVALIVGVYRRDTGGAAQ
jgi:hypothetical protein